MSEINKENREKDDGIIQVIRIFANTILFFLAFLHLDSMNKSKDEPYFDDNRSKYFKLWDEQRRIKEIFNQSFNINGSSLEYMNKNFQTEFQDYSINIINKNNTEYYLQRSIENEYFCEYINFIELEKNRKPIFIEMMVFGYKYTELSYKLWQIKNGDPSVIKQVLEDMDNIKDKQIIPHYDLFLKKNEYPDNFCFEQNGKYTRLSKI